MATFAYRATERSGKEIRGRIDASGEGVVVNRLREMGYFPTEVRKIRQESTGSVALEELPGIRLLYRLITGGRVKRSTRTTFLRELATLLGAGLPLLRSLEIVARNTDSSNMKRALKAVETAVQDGTMLSQALAAQPRVFTALDVNMVKAGEIGGALEEVLERLATYYEKSAAQRGKVLSALYYPSAVLVLATAIITLILVFVVPRLQEIYASLGRELPGATRALIYCSEVIRLRAPWVAGGLVLALLLIRQAGRTGPGRYVLDRIRLRLPVFGVLVQKVAVARFARTLSTLLEAGVPILQALVIARDSSGNEVLARAIVELHAAVRQGEPMAEPLARCPVFPELVVHMVAVGEETGEVDAMLRKVAEAYERQVDDLVNGLTALIEPLLVVFLGVGIGLVVIALYLPLLRFVDLF